MEKIDLLTALDSLDTPTALDVSSLLSIDYRVAAVALLRLVRAGLVRRWRTHPGDPYLYELTESGENRLAFLEQREEEEADAEDAEDEGDLEEAEEDEEDGFDDDEEEDQGDDDDLCDEDTADHQAPTRWSRRP